MARGINKGIREYKYISLPWVDVCLHVIFIQVVKIIYIYIYRCKDCTYSKQKVHKLSCAQ